MKCAYLLIASILVLVGCSNQKEPAEPMNNADDSFVSYQLNINSEKKKLASLIELVEVIPLEETDQSLLSNIHRIEFNKEEYLVLNERENEIVFFDEKGKYIKTFNRVGKGPEEYEAINSFWVNEDTLSIYERKKSILYRYTISGEFIDARNIPFRFGHIRAYEGKYVVELNFNAINDTSLYKFAVLNPNLEPTELYLKSEGLSVNVIWNNQNSVIPYNDGMLLMRMYCDTAYYYKGGQFEPLFHFDFGDDWYWENGENFQQEDYELIGDSGQAWDVVVSVSSKYVYVRTVVAFSHYEHFLIDRSTNEAIRIDLKKNAEEEYVPTDLGWQGGLWVISMLPDDILKLLEELNYDLPNAEKLSQSENPALVKIKFKNSEEW